MKYIMIFLLLASLASAADLGDFPNLFVDAGTFYGNIVVGDDAASSDVIGSIAIATAIQKNAEVPVTAAKLASEIEDITKVNTILVGGPCANHAVSVLMGNPLNCVAGFEEGKAMIKVYEHGDYQSVLVAGYSALDTRRASIVLAQAEDYSLVGTEAVVTGTSLTDIAVELQETDSSDSNDQTSDSSMPTVLPEGQG